MSALEVPVPVWLGLDGGVRALPPAARAALYDVALAGGSIRCGADPRAALDALCSGAGAALDTMESLGVITLCGGRLSLVAPEGVVSRIAAAARSGSTGSSTAGPLDRRALSKRLAARWSEKGLKTVEARNAWIESEAGRASLVAMGVDACDAKAIAATAGQRRGQFGRDRAPVTRGAAAGATADRDECHGVATIGATAGATAGATTGATAPPPSALPPGRENDREEEPKNETIPFEIGVTRHGATAPRTDVASASRLAESAAQRIDSDATQRHHESARPIAAARESAPRAVPPTRLRDDDPLSVIAEASKGGVSGIAAAHVRMELVTFASTNGLVTEDFVAVGQLLATAEGRRKAWPWMDSPQRAASVALLRGRDGSWSSLSSAIEFTRAASRPVAPRPAPGSSGPARRPGPIATADDTRRLNPFAQKLARKETHHA